jgi:hypothetical protein
MLIPIALQRLEYLGEDDDLRAIISTDIDKQRH